MYFVLGFGLSLCTSLILIHWAEVVSWFTQRPFIWDRQPEWLKFLHQFIASAPWLLGAALLLIRWLGRREVRWLAYALGAFSLYAIMMAYLLLPPVFEQWRYARPFEAAIWRANPEMAEPGWPLRLRMVDDLLAGHRLTGLTREQVESLLGPADQHGPRQGWDLMYYLGPERGLIRLDSENLGLRFGADGRLAETAILRD